RETAGHGQPEARHLRDVGALAAEEVAHAAGALVEVVDQLHAHHARHSAPPGWVILEKSATRRSVAAAPRTRPYRRARAATSSVLTSTSWKKRSRAGGSSPAAARAAAKSRALRAASIPGRARPSAAARASSPGSPAEACSSGASAGPR